MPAELRSQQVEPLSSGTRYVVYCDESRHDSGGDNKFMGIGGLWVPADVRNHIHGELKARTHRLGLRGEIKWSKVSAKRLEEYRKLIDFFADTPELLFRVILVDHGRLDHRAFSGGDAELGFYKFYYEMLVKWLEPGNEYLIILDHKLNSGQGRYSDLERVLRYSAPQSTLLPLAVADSRESRLAQLADLLTGAVTAAWCGAEEGSPKAELMNHLATRMGWVHLRQSSASPAPSKLNIFNIRLQ